MSAEVDRRCDDLIASVAARRVRVMSAVILLGVVGTFLSSEAAGVPLTRTTIAYNVFAMSLLATIVVGSWLRKLSPHLAVVSLTLSWLVPVGGTLVSQYETGEVQLIILVLLELLGLVMLLDTRQTIACAALTLALYLPLLVRDARTIAVHVSIVVTAALFGVVLQIVSRRALVRAELHRIAEAVAAAELERNLVDLERSESERARLQESLLHAQRLEAVATLAAGIAHDMNNVLAAITNYANVIASEHPDANDSVQPVIEQALRGAELTRGLLAFGRRGQYRKQRTYLNDVVGDAVPLIKNALLSTHELVVAQGSSTAIVDGDRVQLRQVLVNLCINARDAMPDGGTILVASNVVDLDEQQAKPLGLPPGPYIQLHVADSGTGIDAATLPRLFEPFFTTKPVGQGTGLGLAFVWGVVQAHHGTVVVESEAGHGARFTVLLPKATKAAVTAATPDLYNPGPGTVLVIDDEAAVRNSTARMLQRKGYRVLMAENGADGLRAFASSESPIGLVILDMGMPVMGGAECFARLRAQSDVPVLIATGYAIDAELQDMISRGARLIEKPYKARDLMAEIERIKAVGAAEPALRDSDSNLTPTDPS
ncbi:MAG: response regulator [Myxococcota bacterium]|nr:response regulator [Myxococcota bacterium]